MLISEILILHPLPCWKQISQTIWFRSIFLITETFYKFHFKLESRKRVLESSPDIDTL